MTPDLAIVQLFIPSQCCIAALSQVSQVPDESFYACYPLWPRIIQRLRLSISSTLILVSSSLKDWPLS